VPHSSERSELEWVFSFPQTHAANAPQQSHPHPHPSPRVAHPAFFWRGGAFRFPHPRRKYFTNSTLRLVAQVSKSVPHVRPSFGLTWA
jgi:hypothetical protein